MAQEIQLAFPDEKTPGILGFYQRLPAITAQLNKWSKYLEGGAFPKPEEIDAIVDTILFFAVNEPDKEAARQTILNHWNALQIAGALNAIGAQVNKGE